MSIVHSNWILIWLLSCLDRRAPGVMLLVTPLPFQLWPFKMSAVKKAYNQLPPPPVCIKWHKFLVVLTDSYISRKCWLLAQVSLRLYAQWFWEKHEYLMDLGGIKQHAWIIPPPLLSSFWHIRGVFYMEEFSVFGLGRLNCELRLPVIRNVVLSYFLE